MALKEFVGGSGTKQDFQPTPIRGSAYEKRGGQNSIQTPFLSQDFFFWGGGGEWEKWNRLSGCLWLGLNGDETMRNSEPAEAMTCQQAGLQSTTRASSDPAPPPRLLSLSGGGVVSSSQRPLRHSLDTCYFREEEKLVSLFHPLISISFHL